MIGGSRKEPFGWWSRTGKRWPARDLGITENMLQWWRKEYLENEVQAFPGKGRRKPEDAELHQLRRRSRNWNRSGRS
jgi:hypothetical protein